MIASLEVAVRKCRLLSTFLAWLALAGPLVAAPPVVPFPSHTSYAAGSILPDHKTRAQLDAEVLAAWQRWKNRYLVIAPGAAGPGGNPRLRVRVATTSGSGTVSEGQGYGMLLAVLMAGADPESQEVFDCLWAYALDHPSLINGNLMDWSVPADESLDPEGNDSAFDGDADMAMALLMADRQWGSAGGFYNYRAEAARVLAALEQSVIGNASRYPLLGDWVEQNGGQYNQWTVRTSDFMPGHFRAFYQAGRTGWFSTLQQVRLATDLLQTDSAPSTGLLPDFTKPKSAMSLWHLLPADPNFLESPHDGHYWYNAGRDPWRLASDALISGELGSRTQAQRLLSFVRSSTGGDPLAIKIGYELDGTPIIDGFSSFFAAPLVTAATLDPSAQSFLNAGWDAVATRVEGYYEDSVTLLCLIVMSGNFWDPVQLFADGFEAGNTGRWTSATGLE
jgi:hypothetical protein